MYTKNVNAQIFLSLLKQYGIKKIVISPGAQNFGIAGSAQNDSWFEVYSVVDERSAAYFASGLAFESDEPVVLSCTGATASRNYLPGLTEAYYRKLPIIALTGTHYHPDKKDLSPQSVDRSNLQNDIQIFSAELPIVKNDDDFRLVQKRVNEALTIALEQRGPVHLDFINSEFLLDADSLPKTTMVKRYSQNNLATIKKISGDIGILTGSHEPFSKELSDAISKFAKKFKAPVFCDHTANYHGDNKILISQVLADNDLKKYPDVLIDLGSVIGDYNAPRLAKSSEVWRISEDGVFHDRYNKMTRLFDMDELSFFKEALKLSIDNKFGHNYYKEVKSQALDVDRIGDLPLSNTLIAKTISEKIPKNSSLHLGILNSLRNMDFFELDKSILVSSNVGGFGIDGPISTIVGQSMVDKERLHFCILGDLAFFYDMNALGIRHIGNNLRILIVNNGCGAEFRLTKPFEDQLGEELNDFVAAGGHNGSAEGWAKSMGFEYLKAKNLQQFEQNSSVFCDQSLNNNPILFEVFTKIEDEETGLAKVKSAPRALQ